jgi:hypothetical protein
VHIPHAILERVLRGEVTLVFRRWIRPTVKGGDELRTVLGVVHVETVTRVEESEICEEEARRAGSPSRAELLRELHAGRPGWVYRIEVRAERAARGRPSNGPDEKRE